MSFGGVCKQQCVASDVKCSGSCNRVFHASCIKDDLELKKTRSNWKCRECRSSTKSTTSSGTSTSTPLTKESLIRVLEDFKREVFEEIRSFKKELSEMTESLQFVSDKVDTANSLMTDIKTELSAVKKENEILRTVTSNLDCEVSELKQKVRTLEQYTRINNLEINDVPMTPGENVLNIVKDIGKALNVELHEDQVEAAHRVPSYNRARTPALIVRFQSRTTRDKILGAYRQKKTLDAKEVNKAYPSQRMYVNEHLSPDNKRFLSEIKKRCRDAGFAFAWCKDGKFFVKKAQGESTKKIVTAGDLETIK